MAGVVDIDLEVVLASEVEGGLDIFRVCCIDDPGFASWSPFWADRARKRGG
jgi:monomeric isocitrate dehydrogenase